VRSSERRFGNSFLAAVSAIAGLLTASVFGPNAYAQDQTASQVASPLGANDPSGSDVQSIAVFIAIAAVFLALWALFEAVRSQRRLKRLEESYFKKEYIAETVKSEAFIGSMRSHFVPYNAAKGVSRANRGNSEFGDLASIRADLHRLLVKLEPATGAIAESAPEKPLAQKPGTGPMAALSSPEGVPCTYRAKQILSAQRMSRRMANAVPLASQHMDLGPLKPPSEEPPKQAGERGNAAPVCAEPPESAMKQTRLESAAKATTVSRSKPDTEPHLIAAYLDKPSVHGGERKNAPNQSPTIAARQPRPEARIERAAIPAIPAPPPPAPPPVLPPPLALFAPWPTDDGAFENLDDREEYGSLFKLTLDGSAETATSAKVELCDNPDRQKSVIPNHDMYLSPVCNYEQTPAKNAQRIIVKRPGRAVRKEPGQLWRIKDKLQIEFR
jgi:hypothetical protein